MSIFGEILKFPGKQNELEERMNASIRASCDLTVELKRKYQQDERMLQSLDKLTAALCEWTKKAEEIKHLVLSKRQ